MNDTNNGNVQCLTVAVLTAVSSPEYFNTLPHFIPAIKFTCMSYDRNSMKCVKCEVILVIFHWSILYF